MMHKIKKLGNGYSLGMMYGKGFLLVTLSRINGWKEKTKIFHGPGFFSLFSDTLREWVWTRAEKKATDWAYKRIRRENI